MFCRDRSDQSVLGALGVLIFDLQELRFFSYHYILLGASSVIQFCFNLQITVFLNFTQLLSANQTANLQANHT
jgi:hypothetical protein